MNLTTFRSRVSAAIGLDNTDGGAEQGYIDSWVNEAVEQFLARTGIHAAVSTSALTPGDGDYELDSSILEIKDIYITDAGGNNIPLEPMQEHEILERRRYASAGDHPYYYAVQGANLLMLWPTPSSALTLTYYYVPKPSALLVSGSDDPSTASLGGIPTQFHPALEAYAKWRGSDYDDDATAQEGLVYQQEWEKELAQARITMNRMKGWAPARIGRRKRFPVKPGVDFGFPNSAY